MKISYIIITWNGLTLLKQLLQSLTRQMQRSDVEVILCDNGSMDGTEEFISSHYPKIRYIRLPENKGVAFARNRALEAAKGQYLFIVDNDLVLTDEAAEGLEAFMDTNKEVGLAAPALLYPDGRLQGNAKYYPSLRRKVMNVLCPSKRSTDYLTSLAGTEPFEAEYVIGACQMIRREALEAVGLLDERIFYGPEDADYCIRLRKAGWKVICVPSIHVIHHCQRRTTARPFSSIGRKHIRALLYFYWKHKKI